MEVEHHYLAFERGEALLLSVVVGQCDGDHAEFLHLGGLCRHGPLVVFHDALVLHALERDVVQVMCALRVRVECVPRGGDCAEDFVVCGIHAWVEDHMGLPLMTTYWKRAK